MNDGPAVLEGRAVQSRLARAPWGFFRKPRQARRLRARVVFAALAASVAFVAPNVAGLSPAPLTVREARADTAPDVWARAKDRQAKLRYDLHVMARSRLSTAATMRSQEATTAAEGLLETARALLEQAGVEKFDDPVLLFDLGDVYEQLDRHADARRVLEKGLALAPEHPAAEEAWLTLAYAYAKSDLREQERAAYLAYLRTVTDDRPRMTAELNLAESEMGLGHLAEAVRGYQGVIALTARMERTRGVIDTETLALWGLAVALDRRGDVSAVEATVDRAFADTQSFYLITSDRNVFFVPSYERLWYIGLALSGQMRRTSRNDDKLALARQAVTVWQGYVRQANATDRWVATASRHLARAEKELHALETRGAGARPRSPDVLED